MSVRFGDFNSLELFGGIGAASRAGVLVKGSNYLEALTHVKTFVFDKTGTLTKGKFAVTKVLPNEGVSETELVFLAACCEQFSPHPIARSIVDYYDGELKKATFPTARNWSVWASAQIMTEKRFIAATPS